MTIDLLRIQYEDVEVLLRGTYESSKHCSGSGTVSMNFHCSCPEAMIEIYNGEKLVHYEEQPLPPIFFENGRYEVLIGSTNGTSLCFYHEYAPFREAITESVFQGKSTLTGTLNFQNEVGLSEMEIQKDGQALFTFTIEIFPTKLDYQNDYKQLLDEVNNEIYNLAYSFIKKTYINAARKEYKDPTYAEFYRIFEIHMEDFKKAIAHIERFPHHKLETTYEEVRGERLRQQDSEGLRYLRNNAQQFVDVARGIPVGNRIVMPKKGLLVHKQQNYDTHENRYVKWAITRIYSRVQQLKENYLKVIKNKQKPNEEFIEKIEQWLLYFQQTLQKPFWRKVGVLDRSVYSLVMQMATGYKDVFQIYQFLSQSLVLQNDLYKMSVKDIARLYEYWTFLKLGKILATKTQVKYQDLVETNNNGLYIHLLSGKTVTRTFEQPLTKEKITLCYQYKAYHTPTVRQEPDTMLSIEKYGRSGVFRYIFDAKYAIHIGSDNAIGPKHEDINAMHRYRDAIVAKDGTTYERETFGAYVLFPWKNDEQYRNHTLYKSIELVNIGGLPFLPNETALVEQIIDNLLYKSADELQREGILPKGAASYLQSKPGQIIILHEQHVVDGVWEEAEIKKQLVVPTEYLPANLAQIQEIAIVNEDGIHTIVDVVSIEKAEHLTFNIVHDQPHRVKTQALYSWQQGLIVPIQWFDQVDCLEELFVRNERQQQVVKLFKRISQDVQFQLSTEALTPHTTITHVTINSSVFELRESSLVFGEQQIQLSEPEYVIFKWIVDCLV